MKRFVFLILVLTGAGQLVWAQSNDRLERIVVKSMDAYFRVNEGEFQVQHVAFQQPGDPRYWYYYVATNEYSNLSNVYDDGKAIVNQKCQIRPFMFGPTWRNSIFVVKFLESEMPEGGYGKEIVVANGERQNLCDSVISVSDDGYVFRVKDKYYYSNFTNNTAVTETSRILWMERMVFHASDNMSSLSKEDKARLSEGDVYYASTGADGHYYYLYRDAYMPNTLLIIDGKVVELFGVFSYENFRLKYSYNGKHWMAVADDRFWVDGEMKSVKGYEISDFLVSDGGDYMYKAGEKGNKKNGEAVVLNGQLIRRNAHVGYFGMNDKQKLKFHFLSGGQCFVYENGTITNLMEDTHAIYYVDDKIEGLQIKMYSNNGRHLLSYVTGQKGLEIDGEKVMGSIPFQVFLDKANNCFQWNAIEEGRDGKTELVVYKYHCTK